MCSITLRDHSVDDVIAAAVAAGIEAVEWGADRHAPPGDTATATAIARRCADAGLICPSYGSYLFVAGIDPAPLDAPVDAVLDTALALGASTVRVWTPFGVTPDAPVERRTEVVEGLRVVCARAADRDLRVALEFHPGTLTHTAAATNLLLDTVDAPNLFTYWQPETGHVDDAWCRAELDAVMSRLAHLHVFSWGGKGIDERRPLAARAGLWTDVLAAAAAAVNGFRGERVAYLEYVEDDSVAALARDAQVLRTWLARGAA